MVSSGTHCCVARLDEAASQAQRRAARRPALASLVEPSGRKIHACGVCTRPRDCGKTCPRGVAHFEVGGLELGKALSRRFSRWRARSTQSYTRQGRIWQQSPAATTCSLQSLAIRRPHKKQAPAISAGCKSHATRRRRNKQNHDARRNDDATYRKTRKNSKRLRAPTIRTKVRKFSRERIESRS